MVVAGRRKSIALYIALCAGLILVSVLLYVGWIVLSWRSGALLFLGVLLLATIMYLPKGLIARGARRRGRQPVAATAGGAAGGGHG